MDNQIIWNGGKAMSVAETLNYWRNQFVDKMVSALIDLRHYEAIEAENPSYEMPLNDGRKAKIATLVSAKREGARYSRKHVVRIDEMLAAIEGKTEAEALEVLASDASIGFVPSPFNGEEGSK